MGANHGHVCTEETGLGTKRCMSVARIVSVEVQTLHHCVEGIFPYPQTAGAGADLSRLSVEARRALCEGGSVECF